MRERVLPFFVNTVRTESIHSGVYLTSLTGVQHSIQPADNFRIFQEVAIHVPSSEKLCPANHHLE